MSLSKAILGLLTYQSATGYDINSVIEQSIKFFWSAQLSQIYHELDLLEKNGFVSFQVEPQKGKPDRKVYTITETGKKTFHEWMMKFPQTLSHGVRDEFSVRLFFGAVLPPEEMTFQLKRFIKEKEEELNTCYALEAVIEDYAKEIGKLDDKVYWRFTLKKGVILAEASIRWAKECIGELEK